jgi:hypothetical protein
VYVSGLFLLRNKHHFILSLKSMFIAIWGVVLLLCNLICLGFVVYVVFLILWHRLIKFLAEYTF